MTLVELARKLRPIIELSTASLDDKTASNAAELFPKLKQDDSLIETGTRINWYGVIKRATVSLWDTAENSPNSAPTLWEDIPHRDGYRIIPQIITAGTSFTKYEYGWWEGVFYQSAYDGANVCTPEQYPNGWIEVN